MPQQGPGMLGPPSKGRSAPKYALGRQAAGGAVLKRGTFQLGNRRQQAELRQGVRQNAQAQAHVRRQKLAHAFAVELYKHGHRKEALKVQENAGLGPHSGHALTHVLPGEKLPVVGQLIAGVDPVVVARTAAHNLTTVPWQTSHRALRLASTAPVTGTVFPGRGGIPHEPEIPRVPALPDAHVVYHGSPEGRITQIDPTRHTKSWREGIGFYVTESPEKAQEYARGRTATGSPEARARGAVAAEKGAVTPFKLSRKARVLDMDKPADLRVWARMAKGFGFDGKDFHHYVVRQAGANPTNARMRSELLTQIEDTHGNEAPYAIEDALANEGIQATTHLEGTKTGKPHRVWVVKDASILAPHQELAPEVAAAQKVAQSLGPARARRAAQEGLYREERGKRIARTGPASQRAGGGEAGFEAAKAELRGELPKVKFQHLREGKLSKDEYHTLLTQIQNHPDLSEWDKLPAQQALQNAFRDGITPRKSEIRHLETVFGQDNVKEIVHLSKLVKAGQVAINVGGIPRSLMASYDVSAPGRQGLIGGAAHPVMFGKTFKPMMRSLVSEAKYKDELTRNLHQDPDYERLTRAGLSMTELGDLGSREEPFPSSYAEKIPIAGHGVRASGRAYTAFLDLFRLKQAKAIIEYDRKRGVNTEDRAYLRKVASHVNTATGRGNLGPIESWGPALNALFFSPRLAASRVSFLLKTVNPYWWAKASPGLRREMVRSYAGLGALTGGAVGTAKALGVGGTSYDPRNADFLKLRMGNTRLDLLGGLQQYARLAAQEYKGQSISSTTGELQKLGPGLGQRSRGDIFMNFLTQKLAPTPSFLWYASHGKNYAGQPFNVKNEIAQRLVPLGGQDAYNLYQQTHNIPETVAGTAASSVGVSVQSYGPRQLAKNVQQQGRDLPKTLMQAAKKAGLGDQFKTAITPELKREIKTYTMREAAYAQLRQKKGHLTPADRFTSDVNLLVKNGVGSSTQAAEAAKWAQTATPSELKKAHSALSRRFFSFSNLNHVVTVLGDHGQKVKLPYGG